MFVGIYQGLFSLYSVHIERFVEGSLSSTAFLPFICLSPPVWQWHQLAALLGRSVTKRQVRLKKAEYKKENTQMIHRIHMERRNSSPKLQEREVFSSPGDSEHLCTGGEPDSWLRSGSSLGRFPPSQSGCADTLKRGGKWHAGGSHPHTESLPDLSRTSFPP